MFCFCELNLLSQSTHISPVWRTEELHKFQLTQHFTNFMKLQTFECFSRRSWQIQRH